MFTGLVSELGRITSLELATGQLAIAVAPDSKFLAATKVGDSIAVNGVCLTVTALLGASATPNIFTACLGQETLARTTFAALVPGKIVNLEPSLTLDTPLGGHLVAGHVDGVLEILEIIDSPNSVGDKLYRFSLPEQFVSYVVGKGSACINGVSLTVVKASAHDFTIMLIPHTLANTNLGVAQVGELVNFEIDLLARYAAAGKVLSQQSLVQQQLVSDEWNSAGAVDLQQHFATPQELIAEIRAGRMVIIMDDEDRENEGDLVMAARFVTADHINFMVTHARGLVCLPMPQAHGEQLQLPLMAPANRSKRTTNFTISIEATVGVDTGISTADRAHTVQVAANPDAQPEDLVSPGHIFPLLARPGGVLERPGHTEATVDLVTMAGVGNCGVIAEILNKDGTMARRDACVVFARTHGLKIGTIADLIAYRLQHEQACIA